MKGILGIVLIATYLTIFVGWCVNIYKFCNLDFEDSYKAEIVRGIGIPVFPMGAICGLFVDFQEEIK